MIALPVGDRIFEVGAGHPERVLFDCLMPTPYGTTYNAYLIEGEEKTALIDTVDPEKTEVLIQNLKEADVSHLDYLIILHTEQDHSGSIAAIVNRYPAVQVIGNEKIRELLATHLHYDPNQVLVVKEGDSLNLGGRTIRFLMTPFAHWPDNMMAFLEEERILFSNDLFGSHYATPKTFATSSTEQRFAAKTYYAEIMMPFRTQVARYTERVRQLRPNLIAPSHGPVWYDPNMILSRYEKWTSDGVKKLVTIPYVSMHDSTRTLVERLTIKLSAQGISIICRDLGNRLDSLTIETGHLITDLVDAAAVIFASPTVLGGPHPNIAYAATLANAMRPKTRFIGLVGSYGWQTQIENKMQALTENIKAERLPAVLAKGLPKEDDLSRLDSLAFDLGARITSLPLLID